MGSLTRVGLRAARVAAFAAGVGVPIHAASAQRVLTVVANDTALVAAPTMIAGLATLRLVLQGPKRRDLVIRRIPAGSAPEVFVRGAAGRTERWFTLSTFGGPAVPRDSMTDATAIVDLRPGRYALVSYEVDASGRPQGDKYLWRMVTAIAASVLIPARFGQADVSVKVKDARVELTGTARPGQRVIQVENAGARPHELIIGRLKPGKSLADVQRWNRDKGEPAPFVYVGGLTPMASGVTAQTRVVLQTGMHVVLCAMRSEHARAPDHELGVAATFNVN